MSLFPRLTTGIAAVALSALLLTAFSPAAHAIGKVDKVVVIKNKKLLILLKDGEVLKAYKVSLGKSPQGAKVKEGDKKTPEGTYTLDYRKARSSYYRAFHISYPNERDVEKARKLGVSPGGGIELHGLPRDLEDVGGLHRGLDWTDGCIAVTNREMDEICALVAEGTPIEIRP